MGLLCEKNKKGVFMGKKEFYSRWGAIHRRRFVGGLFDAFFFFRPCVGAVKEGRRLDLFAPPSCWVWNCSL